MKNKIKDILRDLVHTRDKEKERECNWLINHYADQILAHFPTKQEKCSCGEYSPIMPQGKSLPQQDRIEPLDLSRIDKHDTIKLAGKINEIIAHNNQISK